VTIQAKLKNKEASSRDVVSCFARSLLGQEILSPRGSLRSEGSLLPRRISSKKISDLSGSLIFLPSSLRSSIPNSDTHNNASNCNNHSDSCNGVIDDRSVLGSDDDLNGLSDDLVSSVGCSVIDTLCGVGDDDDDDDYLLDDLVLRERRSPLIVRCVLRRETSRMESLQLDRARDLGSAGSKGRSTSELYVG